MDSIHILNGDSLHKIFPKKIPGQKIVMRECFVDGDVMGDSLVELLQTRAKFISTHYPDTSKESYYELVLPELEKMQQIPSGSNVYCWFEEDLFCQINWWFTVHFLQSSKIPIQLHLVKPAVCCPYSFAMMTADQLTKAFQSSIPISSKQITQLSQLWRAYQSNYLEALTLLANKLEASFPFIAKAVEAHILRFPSLGKAGKPEQTLRDIMKELNSNEFVPVFNEFSKREAIYGFGDLQVKRLFDKIVNA